MDEETQVFGWCPFAGVFCRVCKDSITTEGTPTQERNMSKHLLSNKHIDSCNVPVLDDAAAFVAPAKMKLLPIAKELVKKSAEDARLAAFVASAKMELLPIAQELVKARTMKKSVEDARLILDRFLQPSTCSWHCPTCNRYVEKINHVKNHRLAMKQIPGRCPKALRAGGNNRIIATDYDPYNFSDNSSGNSSGIFPKLFRDLLDKEYTGKQQGRLVEETKPLPKAKRAKRTPQPPFQAENSAAYVGVPPLYAVYPYWSLPGNFSQVGWPPWQLQYWNVGNFNVVSPLFSAVAQPDFGEAESVPEIQEYRSQSMQEGQAFSLACVRPSETRVARGASKPSINTSEKTGMTLEPPLPGYSANLPAANKASEAVRQDEIEVTVNGQGDSEEGRPCTQPARSTRIEDAQLLFLLSKQAGPEPRESLKPSRTTPSQERQGQSNTDTTEEPTSVVQISSPSGASNGSSTMLKRDERGEDTERQGGDQVDARSKTPPLGGSVQDYVTQPSVPAKSPLEPSSCDPMIQESDLDVDTFQQKRNDSMSICDSNVLKVVSNEDPLQGGVRPPHRSTRSTTVSSTKASGEYVEELAFVLHNPPEPDTDIRLGEQAVSADNLLPLPDTPLLVIPANTECKWTFSEESRVLLVDFKGIDRVSPADKRAFAEMLQRDDITVVAEGLLEGIDPKVLTLEHMAVTVKDHLKVRAYKRNTSGDFVTYKEEQGHLSMTLSDFLGYLTLRKKALNPSRSGKVESAFSFTDRQHNQVNVDVTDPLYLIDIDMANRLSKEFTRFSQALKIPEILPGGEWCMTNEVLGQTLVALLCVVHPEVFLTFFLFYHTL
jgi:hypothetical protein